MPKASQLPALSSTQVINALKRCGFVEDRQKGSHVVMVRTLPDGKYPVPIVAKVKRIPHGTLSSILKKVERAGVLTEHFLANVK